MKRNVKKVLLVTVFCSVLMIVLIGFNAVAADESALEVQFVGDSCIISGCDPTASGSLSIPSEISGKAVVRINESAFSKCKTLEEIIIPDSVIYIGKNAFANCFGLRKVIMTDSVTKIEQGIFYQCANLESIILSDNITQIPKDTFYMCTSLENVTLPSKIILLGGNAFFGCKKLKEIILPEGVVSISARCFSNCVSLGRICLPSSLEEISEDAFEKCEVLNTVYYTDSEKAFASVNVSGGNEYLENAVFRYDHDHIKSATFTTVAPTCTNPGYSTYLCECGFNGVGDSPAATGHNLTVTETVRQADCTTKGIVHRKCKNCSYYEVEETAAKGHVKVVDKAVASTCTVAGKTEGSHCSSCGKVLVAQTTLSLLAHDFTVMKRDNEHLASKATYKDAEKYFYSCSRCGKISDTLTFSGDKLVLPKVEKLTFKSTASTVTLAWSKVNDARGYAVYKRSSDGKWSFIKRVRTNSIKLTDLTYAKTYIYGVRAYVSEQDSLVYAPEYASVKAATKPLPTSKIAVKQNEKAITLEWKKSKGASGYRVYKYDSKKEKWTIICSSTKMNKFTLKNLKSGYSYKFSVRSFIDTGNELVWSSRSDSVTTCTRPASPVVKTKAYKNSIKLQWEKVKYADGYTVYVSTNPNSGYKKVETTKKTSCKIEKLKSEKTYYIKVYSYKNPGSKNVYSYAGQIKKVKTK